MQIDISAVGRKWPQNRLVKELLAALVLLVLAIAPWQPLKATHIVGGEMGYRCLGNNRYEITLRVFRDCFSGDELAPFDDPAAIGIFDRDGLLLRNLQVAKMGDDTLTNVIDKCVINSRDVCVHTTTYRTIVTLEPRAGGYHFVYQRCCRNATVRNVVKPLETGATFDIVLTEAAMARCNNSPQFRAWPPIFICRDEPLNFDHSATDEDGDSLVYKLFTPFQGGTIFIPKPNFPDSPPYDTVVWNNAPGNPIYSINNMMGFGTPLVINPVNGLMTAQPGQVGQYVIGVSIEEYDRTTRQLLSLTRRDFQYNVIECERITAAISAPAVQCDNLTVKFENTSENAANFLWYFEGPGFEEISTDFSPTITFPDTGRYTATLVAEPGLICEHRSQHAVFLQYNSIKADFSLSLVDCFGGQSFLKVNDLSTDAVSPIVGWKWEVIVPGRDTLRSNVRAPEFFSVPTGVTGKLRLTLTSQNGCVAFIEKPFQAGSTRPSRFVSATRIEACLGQKIQLNPIAPGNIPFLYQWTPADGLENPNSVNPSVTVAASRTYRVRITPLDFSCDTFINVEVVLVNKIPSSFTYVPACDGFGLHLNSTIEGPGLPRWIIGDLKNPIGDTVAQQLTFTFPSAGVFPVTLISPGLCPDTLTRQLTVTGPFLNPAFSVKLEGCSDRENRLLFEDKTLNLLENTNSWRWLLSDGQLSTQQNPVFVFADGIDSVGVSLIVGTGNGCLDTVSSRVNVKLVDFLKVTPPPVAVVCKDVPTPLNANASNGYRYAWTPTAGLDNPNAPNPRFTSTVNRVYQVTISDFSGVCDTVVGVSVEVIDFSKQVPKPAMVVCPDIPTQLNPGSDPRLIYRWTPASGLSNPNSNNPTVTTRADIVYQLRVSDPLGLCDTTVAIQVKVANFPSVAPVPAMVVCPGIATPLNPKGDPLYKYVWTPATGLSATDVPNPLVTTTVDRTYQVLISDLLNNCGETFTIQVRAADFPSVAPSPRIVVCEGIATSLNPRGDSLYKYEWTPATGLSATDVPNPTVTTTVGRTYQVRISGPLNNCSQTFTVQVVLPDFLAVGPDTVITVCKNVPTPINPKGNNNFSYFWSPATGLNAANVPNPILTVSTPQIYAVTIRDSTGRCQFSYPVRINISPAMDADAGKDTTLCSVGTFTVQGSAINAVRFQWSAQRNFSTIIGENVRQAVNLTRGNNLFYLRTTDALGCVEIDSVAIRAFPLLASVPASITACLPDDRKDITVTNGDPGQTLSYRWSPSNLIISDPNAGPTAIIRAQTGATVSVVVTNQAGCSATFNTRLEVLNLPSILTIEAAKNPIKEGETTTLTVRGCQDCTVAWSPSTGLGNTNGAAVSASPDKTTTYVATVSKAGCVDTLSITLVVEECVEPFVPNAFTPNGDNINDILYARLKDYQEMRMIIYNRWGQEVFDTRDPQVGWDGTYRGRQLPPDVYGYYVYVLCPNGAEFKKSGSISLIR